MTHRIAMWSGPRNISTAMMRSWENRPDCSVVDEPFYACYLSETGLDHPCREAILQAQSCERGEVIRQLSVDPVASGLFYQKHMTHHMPVAMDMSWCEGLLHCFLIRDPAEIIASYLQKMPTVSEDAIGIVRQLALFDEITQISGERPLVIDSNDVLKNPAHILGQLCDHWQIPRHSDYMLTWPPGRRSSDGVWADHWYHAVDESTGFAPYLERNPQLAPEHRELAERMNECYQQLSQYRIRPD